MSVEVNDCVRVGRSRKCDDAGCGEGWHGGPCV